MFLLSYKYVNIMTSSLSISGRQDMINAAKSYIVDHGLNFNPTTTICKTFGTCQLWKNSQVIMLQVISTSEYKLQLSARRAYYGLQSSGVCCDGVAPKTHKHKVGIQPILTYGCSAVNNLT